MFEVRLENLSSAQIGETPQPVAIAGLTCPSFSDPDTAYKIYIKDERIQCTCKSFHLYHRKRNTYCKHIKLLAKHILAAD